jgi:rSAM/selenodomain-associated transferase 2/rSAM/selenodomain-associated transferase 1
MLHEVKADFDILVCYSPEGDPGELMELLPGADSFFPQHGQSLGDKMHGAISHALGKGFERCILIGSDLPLLKGCMIREAFRLLDGNDIVLGPTEDGGYYLIGMKEPCEEAFRLEEYGVAAVFEKTVSAAAKAGKTCAKAASTMDIDEPQDLALLAARLELESPDVCPETRAVLKEMLRKVMGNLSISVIIPVYNEGERLCALLELLAPIKEQCEIIIVDGGSSDDTVEQIENMGFLAVRSPKKGRANQMNHGASLAGGEAFWFLPADSSPPADALYQIHKIFDKGYSVGCFHIRFDSSHPLMLLNALLSNMRVRIRNIAFGDQGIFIKRELFEALGGYAAIPLMEDYRLSMDIKKEKIPVGIAKGAITTSERRYLANGRLKTMLHMQKLQRKFRRGDDIEEISKAYEQLTIDN